jgi:hypothetical protein
MLARMPLEAHRPRRRLGVSSLLFLSFFALGALLRLLLCWANRPYNAFDDHFEPILMTMKAGVIPAKDACFQCFQPPVFDWISARIGEAALQAGNAAAERDQAPAVRRLRRRDPDRRRLLPVVNEAIVAITPSATRLGHSSPSFQGQHRQVHRKRHEQIREGVVGVHRRHVDVARQEADGPERGQLRKIGHRKFRWWQRYYSWYRGQGPFPGRNPSLSGLTILSGDGLILLGLVPLVLVAIGFALCVSGRSSRLFQVTPAQSAALSLFPTLLAFNAAGVIALTLRLPVYNSMKPSYFLISTPALMIFLALGAALCEKRAAIKWILSILLGALFALAITHVLHIVLSID